jgi:hypothetical protein
MSLNRRSSATSGYVNWPTHLTNTGEGGMFVRLVVEDDDFLVCCGGANYAFYDECFVGSDKNHPEQTGNTWPRNMDLWRKHHFPQVDELWSGSPTHEDYTIKALSIPYICCMTIASTGASYYDEDKERNWICTFDDLTSNGQDLYRRIEALYPDGTVTLQTWLDT